MFIVAYLVGNFKPAIWPMEREIDCIGPARDVGWEDTTEFWLRRCWVGTDDIIIPPQHVEEIAAHLIEGYIVNSISSYAALFGLS
jgi:hypothetical protein